MNETTASQQPSLNIEKLYLKDLSLEIPHAADAFLEQGSPQIELQLHSQAAPIEEGLFEATITVTVTAKFPGKDKVMFLIEAKQTGIFRVRNLPYEDMGPIVGVACPNILFPYLREVVSDIAVRAGFAPVLLEPINFEALYQQQHKTEAAPATKH